MATTPSRRFNEFVTQFKMQHPCFEQRELYAEEDPKNHDVFLIKDWNSHAVIGHFFVSTHVGFRGPFQLRERSVGN